MPNLFETSQVTFDKLKMLSYSNNDNKKCTTAIELQLGKLTSSTQVS